MKQHLFAVCFLLVLAFSLMACGSNTDKVTGIWKSEHISLINGKPTILFITKDMVSDNKNAPIKVVFEEDSGKVKIINAQNKQLMCTVSEFKDNNAKFDFGAWGEIHTFTKITQEEADKILGE